MILHTYLENLYSIEENWFLMSLYAQCHLNWGGLSTQANAWGLCNFSVPSHRHGILFYKQENWTSLNSNRALGVSVLYWIMQSRSWTSDQWNLRSIFRPIRNTISVADPDHFDGSWVKTSLIETGPDPTYDRGIFWIWPHTEWKYDPTPVQVMYRQDITELLNFIK